MMGPLNHIVAREITAERIREAERATTASRLIRGADAGPRQPGPRREADLGTLARAAMQGEEAAWERLVARFGPTIRSVARRHRLSEADQDEVVQRTWLRLLERIGTVRQPEALGGWLVTTARRESLRIIELSARELPSDEADDRESAAAPVEDAVIAAERRAALYRALGGLRPRQRSLLQLQLAAPAMSYEQLGVALEMPVGGIGPTRGRALAALRRNAAFAEVVGAQCRHGFPAIG
jgi:RNA polymerase sigma factor (sigma-70 family)